MRKKQVDYIRENLERKGGLKHFSAKRVNASTVDYYNVKYSYTGLDTLSFRIDTSRLKNLIKMGII